LLLLSPRGYGDNEQHSKVLGYPSRSKFFQIVDRGAFDPVGVGPIEFRAMFGRKFNDRNFGEVRLACLVLHKSRKEAQIGRYGTEQNEPRRGVGVTGNRGCWSEKSLCWHDPF
jgi:hypothetical protein